MADSYDKAMKAEESRRVRCGADALIWQGFASVAVPGFTINRTFPQKLYSYTFRLLPGVSK